MIKNDSYSLTAFCAPKQMCDLRVYAPGIMYRDFDAPKLIDTRGNKDPHWRYGFGEPIITMRGYSSIPTPREAAYNAKMIGRDSAQPVGPPKVLKPYHSHDFVDMSQASGDARMVLGRTAAFISSHHIVGEVVINTNRLGHLGELALRQPDEQIPGIPSAAMATAIGDLPDLSAYIVRAHA